MPSAQPLPLTPRRDSKAAVTVAPPPSPPSPIAAWHGCHRHGALARRCWRGVCATARVARRLSLRATAAVPVVRCQAVLQCQAEAAVRSRWPCDRPQCPACFRTARAKLCVAGTTGFLAVSACARASFCFRAWCSTRSCRRTLRRCLRPQRVETTKTTTMAAATATATATGKGTSSGTPTDWCAWPACVCRRRRRRLGFDPPPRPLPSRRPEPVRGVIAWRRRRRRRQRQRRYAAAAAAGGGRHP